MNASDIVKAKQNQTLYKAYNNPTVFQSSTYSTLTSVSSFVNVISSGIPLMSTSYTSCINTVYTYVCNPTFISYELAKSVKDGVYECGGKIPSELQWKNTNSTIIYSYSTLSTSPTSTLISTFRITSTTVLTGPSPVICPLIEMNQGTNFDSRCNVCNNILGDPNACCHNCAS
jgi:hypothetical protein